MQETPQSPFHPDSIRRDVGIVVFVLCVLAASVEVFLRRDRTFGERYLGTRTFFAAVLLFFFPVLWPEHDPVPLLIYFGLFLVQCMLIRLAVARRLRRGGPQPHSLYSGTPLLMRLTGRIDEATVKGIVEPMLVFVAGALTLSISQPLGTYLMLASFGLLASVQLAIGAERQRAVDMNDAYIDQRDAAERFRAMQGKR